MTVERTEESDGLKFKLYRGEGAALLAFDLARQGATKDFVGFAVEVRYPGSRRWGALKNRLSFTAPAAGTYGRVFPSTEAPFQKFRWVHVPTQIGRGQYRYRVTAKYMNADGDLVSGPSVENAISLEPQTLGGYLNVGFTRGFASSQAYATRFGNETGILPPPGSDSASSLEHDMEPFPDHYDWLGFEVRRLIYSLLDDVARDPSLTLDALIYECKEPIILGKLESIGSRLRAIVDDHGEQGDLDSAESISAQRLTAAGAQVQRMHFGRQQHNKVLIVRRDGKPIRVLTGSTNFSLRGLYIQANNALHFDDPTTAGVYGELFEAYWDAPASFRKNALSQNWWVVRETESSTVSLCFSPHADPDLSLDPIARAINKATSSVLYSIVFLNQLTGQVRDALDELMTRPLFSYGVAQRTQGLAVRKPDGSLGLLPFEFLGEKAPPPFAAEWHGEATGRSNMVHHKFLVTDFNGKNPTVFTGSSNMAAGGEKANGDNLICLKDRSVAVAYAIEALRMFDHFHFRVRARTQPSTRPLLLARPPKTGHDTWFADYYHAGHVKQRDRRLFIK